MSFSFISMSLIHRPTWRNLLRIIWIVVISSLSMMFLSPSIVFYEPAARVLLRLPARFCCFTAYTSGYIGENFLITSFEAEHIQQYLHSLL